MNASDINWEAVKADYQASGLSLAAFYKERFPSFCSGIKVPVLKTLRARIASKGNIDKKASMEIVNVVVEPELPKRKAPQSSRRPRTPVEVTLTDGTKVKFESACPESFVTELMKSLRSPAP